MRHKLTLGILIFGLAMVVFAEAGEDGNSSVRGLVDGVLKEFDNACAEADKRYRKNIAPTIKRYTLKRVSRIHSAGREAMRSLKKIAADAQKSGSPVGEAMAKDGMAYVDKVMGESEIPLPLGEVWRVKFGDHRYLAILAPVTWEQAGGICKKMGGHLVYIETREEMEFLQKLISGIFVYVGATDKQKEGDWRWLNGRRVNRSFWAPNRPFRGNRVFYGAILYREGMADVNPASNSARGFICEWDK